MDPMAELSATREKLLALFDTLERKSDILKSSEIKKLYGRIPTLEPRERASFGQSVNELTNELKRMVADSESSAEVVTAIDISAPSDVNAPRPELLPAELGGVHPLMSEIRTLSSIFENMGFAIESSREIDDQYHMFDTLNFPKGHPARDDYDTFQTIETDQNGEPFVAPAHTSTMQVRMMKKYKLDLEDGNAIAVVVPDRVFRNEDLDARHEHTFYQVEGVYISKGVHAGMLIATLQTFLSEYYGQDIEVRTNPFYFPFTEPSFEMALGCPFCNGEGCKVCGQEGWIELLGCGMIHPNVMKAADIDPNTYTGFAWGLGIDRLVMMKNQIEDVRHFESAKLDFLRQF